MEGWWWVIVIVCDVVRRRNVGKLDGGSPLQSLLYGRAQVIWITLLKVANMALVCKKGGIEMEALSN